MSAKAKKPVAVGQNKKFAAASQAKPNGDMYLTPPDALECLWRFIPREKFPRVWECCAGPPGQRNIVTELEKREYSVIATDILDGPEHDFYSFSPPAESFDLILTNPPFSNKTTTLQRLLALNKPFACLLPIMALDSPRIRQLLRFHTSWGIVCPPHTINFIIADAPEKKSRSFFSSAWFCYKIDGVDGLVLT